jgi:uncharacterized protein (UPF0147 family)
MSEDEKKLKKLNVRRESRKTAECAHDISLMVDLLAGEITERQQPELAAQLNSCEICRNKLEKLSRVWTLTREVLDDEILPENVRHIDNTEKADQIDNKIDAENKSNAMENTKLVKAGEKTLKTSKRIKFVWLEIAAGVIFLLFVVAVLLPTFSMSRESVRKIPSSNSTKLDEYDKMKMKRCETRGRNNPRQSQVMKENAKNDFTEPITVGGREEKKLKSVLMDAEDFDDDLKLGGVEMEEGASISMDTDADSVAEEAITLAAPMPEKALKRRSKKQSLNISKSIIERKQNKNESRRVCESRGAPMLKPSVTPSSLSCGTVRKRKRKVRTTQLPMSLMTFHVSSKLFLMMGGSDKEVVSYLKQLGVNNLEIERVRYDAKSAILIIRGLSLKEANRLQDVLNILKVVLERQEKLNNGLKVN